MAKGFPVSQTTSNNILNRTVEESLALPGLADSAINYNGNLSPSAVTIGGFVAYAGRMYYIRTLSLIADKDCEILVDFQRDTDYGGQKTGYMRAFLFAKVPYVLPVNQWVKSNQRMVVSLVGPYTSGDTSAIKVRGGVVGEDYTENYNTNADNTILFFGDSNTYGADAGTFATYDFSDLYTGKILNYFINKGKSVRPIVKASKGITTQALDKEVRQNRLDIGQQYSMIVYNAGTNNVLTTNTQADRDLVTANYTNFINWANTRHPNAIKIYCGIFPIGVSTQEADANALRTILSGLVTSLGDTNSFYVNLGSSFTATDLTKYADGGSSKLHPNITGHGLAWTNVIKPVFDANLTTILEAFS